MTSTISQDQLEEYWKRWTCPHPQTALNTYKDGRCLTCKRARDKALYDRRKGITSITPADLKASPVVVSSPPVTQSPPDYFAKRDHGCGQHDPEDSGWICTSHEDGFHVADRIEKDGLRTVLATWPITGLSSPDSVQELGKLINLKRPASAQCGLCGSLGLAPRPETILAQADAHEALNPGHHVIVEAYRAGSSTARASWPVGNLRRLATAGEAGAEVLAAAGKPAPEPKPTTVALPNGTSYRMRQIAGLPDVEALGKLRDSRLPVLLYGPPGTGKTMVVSAAFPDHQRLDGDGDTITDDFTGKWDPSGNPDEPYIWSDGPLTAAMKQGVPLFIDDATLISPKVIAIVYPLMDGRGDLILKAHTVVDENGARHPERVVAQPGFYVIAGHNPGVHGAIMSEALASRFSVHIGVPTDLELARRMKVDPDVIKIATSLAGKAREGKVGWVPQLRELLAYQKISEVLDRTAALANLAGLAPLEDRPEVIEVINTVIGREITPLEMGAVL